MTRAAFTHEVQDFMALGQAPDVADWADITTTPVSEVAYMADIGHVDLIDLGRTVLRQAAGVYARRATDDEAAGRAALLLLRWGADLDHDEGHYREISDLVASVANRDDCAALEFLQWAGKSLILFAHVTQTYPGHTTMDAWRRDIRDTGIALLGYGHARSRVAADDHAVTEHPARALAWLADHWRTLWS